MAVGPLRFFHVNVNCSDLERSLGFYRDLVGLRTTVRTRPERPQPGRAFGLQEVQWDAWIMAGDDAPEGVVLDLLEWEVPRPEGSPPASVTELGFGRLCVLTDDLAGLHRRLTEAGHDVWSPPGRVDLGAEGMAAPELFLCSDPDGTAVQFVQADSTRLAHVNINCSDLERSRHFYCDVLGLNARVRSCPSEPQPGVGFRVDGDMAWDACSSVPPTPALLASFSTWWSGNSLDPLALPDGRPTSWASSEWPCSPTTSTGTTRP